MTSTAPYFSQHVKGRVHIVLSDEGWILERLARELTDRLSYVTYALQPDAAAEIQYYITYGARRERVSPIEISLFTHREEMPAAAERFDAAAHDTDFAVAMSRSTEELLAGLGIERRACIMPGVDLERFRPKLKIAVVGRTYHTGRKGEALVRAVMDLPDIEWHFTGTGWPGVAEHVADADLPAFYRSMDYILVPALNEGGPMSVLEALACGVPVIGSAVGWVPDFPHIPFECGNAESLRSVLEELTAKHFALRAPVAGMTWDRWAEEHDRLFRGLLADAGGTLPRTGAIAAPAERRLRSVALLTHGSEDTTLGGPSVRVPRTAAALQKLNLRARAQHNFGPALEEAELAHLFNVWQPATAVRAARYVKALGKPLVFSPILLDLSEADLWRDALPRAFATADTPDAAEDAAERATHAFAERRALGLASEPEPGYRDTVTELAGHADALVFLSERERTAFEALTGDSGTPGHLVRNPVDAALFGTGDPDLFRTTYGLGDYVLCIARLEPRKNQLMLAAALRETGMPLVLVGHSADAGYVALVDRFGGPDLLRVDRLEPGSEMLRSAIAGARVFALPSWAEGAPLAALEAAAAGANLVLSDRSGEREYFGDRARYCDPASIASIRHEIAAAWDAADTHDREGLKAFVAETYTWDRHARETLAVYEDIAARNDAATPAPLPVVPAGKPGGVVLDVSTWANQANAHTGIVRVERSIARELLRRPGTAVRFIMYHSPQLGFVEVPRDVIANDFLAGFVAQVKLLAAGAPLDLSGHTELVAVGSGWMQNPDYGFALALLARDHRLSLTVLMHDMTPSLFPHWYPAGYGDTWDRNCAALFGQADRLLVYSESTLRDVRGFAAARGLAVPPIGKIRLADTQKADDDDRAPSADVEAVRAAMAGKPYVLTVGGIHTRKNYQLLYDVWLKLIAGMGAACPHLVIVGGVSWNGEELARVFREDRRVSRHIHVLGGIDDRAVDWLYENALFTAYPSLYEGWGLPVGESLSHGKICLSSDTSSMPEIAPALTDLLDPVDRLGWAALIRHYASSASSRAAREAAIRAGFVPTDWSTTTDDLLLGFTLPARQRQAARYNLGSVAIVARNRPGEAFLRPGWFRSETWGSWARTLVAGIEVALPNPPREALVLNVLAKVFKRAEATRSYEVRVNGVGVGRWHFLPKRAKLGAAQDMQVYRAIIPAALVGADGRLVIEFATDQHTAVTEVSSGSTDRRSLGLGLVAFSIDTARLASDPVLTFGGHREVAAILARAGSTDVALSLSDDAMKPAARPDRWVRDLAPLVRRGQPVTAAGARSEGGMLQLALGLSRVRLDRGARLEMVVDARGASAETPVKVAIFLNDQWIGVERIDSAEPRTIALDVDAALLARSDPAMLTLMGEGTAPELMLSRLRFAQQLDLPSARHAPVSFDGTDAELPEAALREGWYDREPGGVWSIAGMGRIGFSLAPEAASDGWLMLEVSRLSSGNDGDMVAVSDVAGRTLGSVRFPLAERGLLHPNRWLAVPLSAMAREDGRLRCDLALSVNDATWPALLDATEDLRRLGVRLCAASFRRLLATEEGAVVPVGDPGDARIAWLGQWTPMEGDARWSGGDTACFAVQASSWQEDEALELRFRLLPLLDEAQRHLLRVTVNGAECPAVEFSSGDHRLRVPLAAQAGAGGVHVIGIAGAVPISPQALGLNDDARPLGLGLLGLATAPFADVLPEPAPEPMPCVDPVAELHPLYPRLAATRG